MKYSKISVLISFLLCFLLASGFSLAQSDPVSLFARAKKELDQNKVTEETMNKLQSFVEANPKNSNGHLYLGLLLERVGLREQAQEQLQLAVEYGPENPEALVALCQKEIKNGHVDGAKMLLEQGLRKFPNNASILVLVGDYFIKQKQPIEARQLLERAFYLDKSIFGLPTSLAQLYLNRDLTKAVRYASLDLEVRPDYLRALRVRGIAYVGLKLYDRARVDLEKVFNHDPAETTTAQALSESYYWLGDYDRALKPALFLLAFSAKPDVSNASNTSWLIKVLKHFPRKEAIRLVDMYNSQIDKRFNLPAYHFCLGLAYDKLGYYDEAIKNYRIAIEKNPEFVQAHYRLGVDLELYKKDYREALDCFTRAHNLRPWDNEINLAFLRIQDRLVNRNRDVSTDFKRWLQGF